MKIPINKLNKFFLKKMLMEETFHSIVYKIIQIKINEIFLNICDLDYHFKIY